MQTFEDVIDLIKQGKRLEAIAQYKLQTGYSDEEATKTIDEQLKNQAERNKPKTKKQKKAGKNSGLSYRTHF